MAASWPAARRSADRPEGWREWFFDAMREHFDAAALAAGAQTRDFRIGGKRIRLCLAGESLAHSLPRAIDHLAVQYEAAGVDASGLTIYGWDSSAAAGSLIKSSPFLLKACLAALAHDWWDFTNPRGQLLDFHEPPFLGAYHPGSQVLSLLDLDRNIGLYWRRAERPLPYYEAGSPLRTMLHWWFRHQGMQFVHAAAVGAAAVGTPAGTTAGTSDGAVLLAGKGGSGKSTAALACLLAGLDYLGDDYCLVSRHPFPSVHSLYNTCKLSGDRDLARFPGLASRVWNQQRAEGEKATVFFQEHWPERLRERAQIQAILLPRVTGLRDTSMRPCTRMEALTALSLTTIAQLPSADAQDLRFMKELVESLPTFALELGTDLSQIPSAIANFLHSTSARAATGKRTGTPA
jgi:hypothetical protein